MCFISSAACRGLSVMFPSHQQSLPRAKCHAHLAQLPFNRLHRLRHGRLAQYQQAASPVSGQELFELAGRSKLPWTNVVQGQCSRHAGLFQLDSLTAPQHLQQLWQHQTLPACMESWQQLQMHAQETMQSILQGANSSTSQQPAAAGLMAVSGLRADPPQQAEATRHPSDAQLATCAEFCCRLDKLLGTLQQVSLLGGFLKDHHADKQWQTAAAAVFVEARTFEQQVCSDLLLQQELLVARQFFSKVYYNSQQQQQQQREEWKREQWHQGQQSGACQDALASSTDCSNRFSAAAANMHLKDAGAQSGVSRMVQLADALIKHVQLEGLNPLGFAGGKHNSSLVAESHAQVLSAEEQKQLLSALQAEQQLLLQRLKVLMLTNHTAPVVELDAESGTILLAPLQAITGKAANILSSSVPSKGQHSAEASAVAGAAASTLENGTLLLTYELVSLLLQLHPDAAVRSEVYAAGLLHKLDQLLLLWGDLAEARRKIARMQGNNCYGDFILQHSLLGGQQAACQFCQALLTALGPAAAVAAQDLSQQQQQHPVPADVAANSNSDEPGATTRDYAGSLPASDINFLMHQARERVLSRSELDQMQPYLQLEQVMRGMDQLLQATLGLSLMQRPAVAGEAWSNRVQVFELYKVRAYEQQQQHRSAGYQPHTQQTQVQQQKKQKQQSESNQHMQHSAGSMEAAAKRVDSHATLQLTNHADQLGKATQSSTQQSVAAEPQLLGTIYLTPSGGYSTQLLLYGDDYSFLGEGLQSGSAGIPPVHRVVPAVAVGLQSNGLLGGGYEQLSLGLWELCHELGHAMHFILSAAGSRSPCGFVLRQQHAASDSTHGPEPVSTAAIDQQAYHLHGAWLPLELLELPSTLCEGFCMDPVALQVLCRHWETGEQLPPAIAERLAKYMQFIHYNPLQYQRTVLAMLFDLELQGWKSRQLGRHAAHQTWQAIIEDPVLSATAGVGMTLQQVASLPRLVLSSGQGFGYAVAWCLAQLLMPALKRHVQYALRCPEAADGRMQQHGASNDQVLLDGQQMWRQLFSAGCDAADITQLVTVIVQLQQHDERHGSGSTGSRSRSHSGASLLVALQQQGMWPLQPGNANAMDVLAVCLQAALLAVQSKVE